MAKVDIYAGDCLLLGQDLAPKDTGNLAFNAMTIRYIPNGFRIYYNGYISPYWIYQQQGTIHSTKNKGFIFPITETAISSYLAGAMGGDKNSLNATRKRVATLKPDNPARQKLLLQSLHQTLKMRW